MSNDGPKLIRPIPRRPFDLYVSSPTPPEEEEEEEYQNGRDDAETEDDAGSPQQPTIDASSLRFLDPRLQTQGPSQTPSDAGSLSRAQSIMNLTASTLFGIYSPTTWAGGARGGLGYQPDRDEMPTTPWGTGAETPAKRSSLDDPTYELVRERRVSLRPQVSLTAPPSTVSIVSSSALRTVLLFGLGMGYGVLVLRLQDNESLRVSRGSSGSGAFPVDGPALHPGYLVFWGVAGVVLGGLLPWFDGVWEEAFGAPGHRAATDGAVAGKSASQPVNDTDWALVMRGIGAFVGIVFAIRKLPWASTMQVSLTLALVNPFLWYLIDRSKPGFILSLAVGLSGSAVLMGLIPEMMPGPATGMSGSWPGTFRPNSSLSSSSRNGGSGGGEGTATTTLGGLASQETVETSIWIISVLFCSCVCFGNIGRRLALNRSAISRGRWAGVR